MYITTDCIKLPQTYNNKLLDSRYSDLRMTKNPGMAGGPRELLSTKESRLGFTCARRALKYMWLTVLGLKDLRNSSDVANNLSVSILELQDSSVRGTSLLPDHKICLLLECKKCICSRTYRAKDSQAGVPLDLKGVKFT